MEEARCNYEHTAEKAVKYQEKLDKGMRAEVKAEREQAKLEREAAVEKRREERRRAEEGRSQGTDVVQISEEAKAALRNREPVETAEPVDAVIYTPSGETAAASAESESTVSFTA